MSKVKSFRNPFSQSRLKSKSRNKQNGSGHENDKKPAFHKVLFEPIEPRLLMSSDLSYTGTSAFDLTLRYDTPSHRLQLIDTATATAVAEQDVNQTDHIVVTGSAQSDKLTIDFGSLSESPIDFSSVVSDFIRFDANSDSDTLKISGKDAAWDFTSPTAGTGINNGIQFSGVEKISGGLSWRMQDRYGVDADSDGRIDMPNTRAYADTQSFTVDFDASAFLVGGTKPSDLSLTINGAPNAISKKPDGTFQAIVPQGAYSVLLTATGVTDGTTWTREISDTINVKDYLFVAIGDSYSSGEGNPTIIF